VGNLASIFDPKSRASEVLWFWDGATYYRISRTRIAHWETVRWWWIYLAVEDGFAALAFRRTVKRCGEILVTWRSAARLAAAAVQARQTAATRRLSQNTQLHSTLFTEKHGGQGTVCSFTKICFTSS